MTSNRDKMYAAADPGGGCGLTTQSALASLSAQLEAYVHAKPLCSKPNERAAVLQALQTRLKPVLEEFQSCGGGKESSIVISLIRSLLLLLESCHQHAGNAAFHAPEYHVILGNLVTLMHHLVPEGLPAAAHAQVLTALNEMLKEQVLSRVAMLLHSSTKTEVGSLVNAAAMRLLAKIIISWHRWMVQTMHASDSAAALVAEVLHSQQLRACLRALIYHAARSSTPASQQQASEVGAVARWLSSLVPRSLRKPVDSATTHEHLAWILNVQVESLQLQLDIMKRCPRPNLLMDPVIHCLGRSYNTTWVLPELLHTARLIVKGMTEYRTLDPNPGALDAVLPVLPLVLSVAHAVMNHRELEHRALSSPCKPLSHDLQSRDAAALSMIGTVVHLCMQCMACSAPSFRRASSLNHSLINEGRLLLLLGRATRYARDPDAQLQQVLNAAGVINFLCHWWRPGDFQQDDVAILVLAGRRMLSSVLQHMQQAADGTTSGSTQPSALRSSDTPTKGSTTTNPVSSTATPDANSSSTNMNSTGAVNSGIKSAGMYSTCSPCAVMHHVSGVGADVEGPGSDVAVSGSDVAMSGQLVSHDSERSVQSCDSSDVQAGSSSASSSKGGASPGSSSTSSTKPRGVVLDRSKVYHTVVHVMGAVHNLTWCTQRSMRSTQDACMTASSLAAQLQWQWLPFTTAILEVALQQEAASSTTASRDAAAPPAAQPRTRGLTQLRDTLPDLEAILTTLELEAVATIELVDGQGHMPWQLVLAGSPAGLHVLSSVLRYCACVLPAQRVAVEMPRHLQKSMGIVADMAAVMVRTLDSYSPLRLKQQAQQERHAAGGGRGGGGGGDGGAQPQQYQDVSFAGPAHSPNSYLGPGWACTSWGYSALAVWQAAQALAAATPPNSGWHKAGLSIAAGMSTWAVQLLLRGAEEVQAMEDSGMWFDSSSTGGSTQRPAGGGPGQARAITSASTVSGSGGDGDGSFQSRLQQLDAARERLAILQAGHDVQVKAAIQPVRDSPGVDAGYVQRAEEGCVVLARALQAFFPGAAGGAAGAAGAAGGAAGVTGTAAPAGAGGSDHLVDQPTSTAAGCTDNQGCAAAATATVMNSTGVSSGGNTSSSLGGVAGTSSGAISSAGCVTCSAGGVTCSAGGSVYRDAVDAGDAVAVHTTGGCISCGATGMRTAPGPALLSSTGASTSAGASSSSSGGSGGGSAVLARAGAVWMSKVQGEPWTQTWYANPMSWVQWEAAVHRLPGNQRGCSNPRCTTVEGCGYGDAQGFLPCPECQLAQFCSEECAAAAACVHSAGHGHTCARLKRVMSGGVGGGGKGFGEVSRARRLGF